VERGDPIQIGESWLFPIVRIWSWRRRRARIASQSLTAQGALMESIAPMAVVLERPGERRLVPILDLTRLLLWAIGGLCLAGTLRALAARRSLHLLSRSAGGEP
jgi:hypothetical protein